jgi:hypothetical protein
MRLPEEKIKQAILHPELPVRTLALHFFSRSFSDDTTVMPLVVEAVENFGREASIHLVGEGENLPQTENTIQWCMEELRQDVGEQDESLDDYRFALSKVVASADPSLTLAKESEILELPGFLPQLGSTFSERIHLLAEDSESLWNRLMDFCERENEKQYLSEVDLPQAHRIVEALGRGGTEVADRVLTMLDEEFDNSDNSPRALMQGFVLRLAGELRLRKSVPSLIQHLREDDDWFNEECQRALTRIGGDNVVVALSEEFPAAEWHFRLFGSGVLEQVHTEGVVQKCIELFEKEENETIKIGLGQAAVSQFATDVIEPVRQFILASKLDPELLELRESLVSASTVLGVEFPEMDTWKSDDAESRSLRRKLFAEKYGSVHETSDDWDDDPDDDVYGADVDAFSESTHSPTTFVRQDSRIGRNDPCPCGSGKKYKKCCMNKSNGNPLLN